MTDTQRRLAMTFVVAALASTAHGGWCQRTVCKTEKVRVCAFSTWQGCCHYKYVWKAVVRTERFCCAGYRGSSCNQPVCNPTCGNGGTCVAPGRCRCRIGYAGPTCRGIEPCSHRSPCFPGICSGTCTCQSGFTQQTCLTLRDMAPRIWQCRARLESLKSSSNPALNGMVMYEFTTDSSNPDIDTEDVIWSNQKGFNYLQIDGAAQFDATIEYPNPSYVRNSIFGVTTASAKVKHTKLSRADGTRYTASEKDYPCEQRDGMGVATVEYWNCTVKETRFDQSITNADEIEVTLTFTSGGSRELINPDNNRFFKTEEYIPLTSSKTLRFKFDLTKPSHCFGTSFCRSSPLSLDRDITRSPVIITWDGWTDGLSGMYRYAWEVFRLDTADGKLKEENPLQPLVNKEWLVGNGTFPVIYTPPEPGMYSVILEASDRANNSRYTRRLFLYDDASKISVNADERLFISSAAAATNHTWQASLDADVVVDWRGHFSNQIHHASNLLNAVAYYPPQFTDIESETASSTFTIKRIQFDDDEGERTRAAIPNMQGVVKFEVAYARDHAGGSTLTQPILWLSIPLTETYTIGNVIRTNGDSIRVWVRATDIMNNTRIDSTVVSFDDSQPLLKLDKLTKNVLNGTYQFSSVVPITAIDEDSGIQEVSWRLVRSSTGNVVSAGTLSRTHYQLNKAECDADPSVCRCTPSGDCFRSSFSLPINHCWLRVEKESLATEVITLDVTVTNAAMLNTKQPLWINNINSFNGVGEYSPPRDVRVISSDLNTVRIAWDLSPSCYNVSEFWITYVGATSKEKIHRLRTTYDLTGLQPETNYTAHLITGYSGEMSDPVEFRFRTDCAKNKFGMNCSSVCHCKGDPCDPVSGMCKHGCLLGWSGKSCDTEKLKAEAKFYCFKVNGANEMVFRTNQRNTTYRSVSAVDKGGSPITTCDQTVFDHFKTGGMATLKVRNDGDRYKPKCGETQHSDNATWRFKFQEFPVTSSAYDVLFEVTCDFNKADTRQRRIATEGERPANQPTTLTESKLSVSFDIIDPFQLVPVTSATLGQQVQLQMKLNNDVEYGISAIAPFNCSVSSPDDHYHVLVSDENGCMADNVQIHFPSTDLLTWRSDLFETFAFPGYDKLLFRCQFHVCFDEEHPICHDMCTHSKKRKVKKIRKRRRSHKHRQPEEIGTTLSVLN